MSALGLLLFGSRAALARLLALLFALLGLGWGMRAAGAAPPARPLAGAADSAERPGAPPSASAPASADYQAPEDYAEVGAAGGVPVHREGRFSSPFAHPRFGGPATVRVGIVVSVVRSYDIKAGSFQAEFYLSFSSDKAMPPMHPSFPNGKADQMTALADKPTFKMYHVVGTFSSLPDLHDYPFDAQNLTIEVEDYHNGEDQVVFVPDREHTNLDTKFRVSGWDVIRVAVTSLDHFYPDRFDSDDLYHARYRFSLGIKRFATSAVFTVFVPAFVIVLIAVSGLWLPREELQVRTNASVPMLTAAVLFHFSLTTALPATPYLTRADKLMLAVYASLVLNMLATWVWFVVGEEHTERLFRLGRAIVPVATVIFMTIGSVL